MTVSEKDLAISGEISGSPARHPSGASDSVQAPPAPLPDIIQFYQLDKILRSSDDLPPQWAALLAQANLPDPAPVPRVSYQSLGETLIIGPANRVLAAAERLAGRLPLTLLVTEGDPTSLPLSSGAVFGGRLTHLSGWLGAFDVRWEGVLPPDAALPEVFDLVLDLQDAPALDWHTLPQGYFAPGASGEALETALENLPEMVGEFEKPKFFKYRDSICAHSRNRKTGCSNCIDVCSAHAISSAGDTIQVDPHLCMGCGACATVCPSGALSYQYPRVTDQSRQISTMLTAYREAGGQSPQLLIHDGEAGLDLIRRLAGQGLPPDVLPLGTHHVASIGLDVLLGAYALGASRVSVLTGGREAPAYLEALQEQMTLAATITAALGYPAEFRLIRDQDPAVIVAGLQMNPPAVAAPGASFQLFEDKRTSIEFALDHLLRHAPSPREIIPLPAGAPFGRIDIASDACTLCMACVSACPEKALMDGGDLPQVRFLEKNCVQCGLCESTCPESAISLTPRLWLSPAVKKPQVLNEAAIHHCTRCRTPMGTQQMITTLINRLAGHSHFATPQALARLKMCGDCRVVDMMESPTS